MKIIIDGRMIGWTGIGRYTRHLLKELPLIDQDNQYVVLLLNRDFASWNPPAPNFSKMLADFHPYSISGQLRLSGLIKSLEPDLVHFTSQNVPPLFRQPFVVTIHDLTLVDFKNVRQDQLMYELKYRLFCWIVGSAVRSAARIITVSQYWGDELHRRYGLGSNRIQVIYEAADGLSVKPAIDRAPNSPFLLYVGNAYPYKNLELALTAFAKLLPEFPELKFVLVGKPDFFYRLLEKQVRTLNIQNSVIFPGFVSDQELAGLYQKTTLLVFPSLSEGFGLPGLEAMAEGAPVIAARASCLPEIYGDAAAYFDPHDVSDMAAKIKALLNNPTELERLRQAGPKQVKKYSWRKMAEQTLEVYRSVMARSRD